MRRSPVRNDYYYNGFIEDDKGQRLYLNIVKNSHKNEAGTSPDMTIYDARNSQNINKVLSSIAVGIIDASDI